MAAKRYKSYRLLVSILIVNWLLASCSGFGGTTPTNAPPVTVAPTVTPPILGRLAATPLIAVGGSQPFTPDPTATIIPTVVQVVRPNNSSSTASSSIPSSVNPTPKANLPITTTPPLAKTPGAVGAFPVKPEDAAAAIAAYLNKQSDTRPTGMPTNLETVKTRLKNLLLDWKATGPTELITAADLTATGHLDLVATFAQTWNAPPSFATDYGYLLVLHDLKGVWTPYLYRKPAQASQQLDFYHPSLLSVINLTRNQYPQIVFSEYHCDSAGCDSAIHILNWYNNTWFDLTPQVPDMENAESISFENRDNNGTLALVLAGGVIKTTQAGPQRRRTEIYRYDPVNGVFRSTETLYADSNYLYFKVFDGNAALSQQQYDAAIATYNEAITNSNLKLWTQEQNATADQIALERTSLVALARFRLGVTYLLKGDRQKASATFGDALSHDGDYKVWTQAFIGPYQANPETATVNDGCTAAVQYSLQHPALIQPLNQFGYDTVLFQPQDICPPLTAKQ